MKSLNAAAGGLWRDLKRVGWIWWFAALPLLIDALRPASTLVSHYFHPEPYPGWWSKGMLWRHDIFCWMFAVALMIVLVKIVMFGFSEGARKPKHRLRYENYWYWSLVAILLVISMGMFVLVQYDADSNGNGIGDFLRHAFENAGGIFAVVTGTASVIGLFITYRSVRDLGLTITSFDELAARIYSLAEDVLKDVAANRPDISLDDDLEYTLRVVCYTPILGFFALGEGPFERLRNQLSFLKNGRRIRIVCLEEDTDLKEWHENFKGIYSRRYRGPVEKPDQIERARLETKHMLSPLGLGPENCRSAVKGVLPGFYFFVTRERAIVVAPLHLPRLEMKADRAGNRSESNAKLFQNDMRDLEMFGTETTDRRIVEDLQILFEQIWNHCGKKSKGSTLAPAVSTSPK